MLTKNNYYVFQLSQCKENLPLDCNNGFNNKLKSFSREKPVWWPRVQLNVIIKFQDALEA